MLTDINRRNNDFITALHRELNATPAHDDLNLTAAIRRAIENGAPRYYFNYETACEMCQRIAKGKHPSGRRAACNKQI